MVKRLISIFVIFIIIFSTSLSAFAVGNPQDAITNSKLKFQQMSDNIVKTNKQISEVNITIEELNRSKYKNDMEIIANNKDIQIEKSHMEQLLKDVNSTQRLANKRLRAMYINDYNESFFIILLSSKSFSDFITKFDAIKNVLSYDKKVFKKLTEQKNTLNESISDLNSKNEKMLALKASNSENLKEMNEERNNLQLLITQFNKEKTSALQIIKENEEKLIAHSVLIIDSKTNSINDVKAAVSTLNSFLPQLSTDSVKKKAKDHISLGNKILAELIAKNPSQPANGNESYKATYTMSATAYTGGTLTALGLKPVRDQANLSTIAVDPSVIPLGTKVYIPGYGNAICSDTGGAIQGNIIDLYMNTEDDCINWGRRNVTVYVIAYPGEW